MPLLQDIKDRPLRRAASTTAWEEAQRLAFAPLLFQAARILRDRGFLTELAARRRAGATLEELVVRTSTSRYGATVLLEAGLAAGLLACREGLYRLTPVGLLIECDPMTRTNMTFTADVCYRAADHLEASIEKEEPAGLMELGPWANIYEGLAHLPEPARTSWLAFDHFYSDDAFPRVLDTVLASRPQRLLDVGGNTGKFATQALRRDPALRVTIADLPGQIETAKSELTAAGLIDRVDFYPCSLLDPATRLPEGHDVVWMSQLLSCFSEAEVVHVLSLAARALGERSSLVVLENLRDRQSREVGAICLRALSLYFTCVANGRSGIHDAATILNGLSRAGLIIESHEDGIGWGHALFICRRAEPGLAASAVKVDAA